MLLFTESFDRAATAADLTYKWSIVEGTIVPGRTGNGFRLESRLSRPFTKQVTEGIIAFSSKLPDLNQRTIIDFGDGTLGHFGFVQRTDGSIQYWHHDGIFGFGPPDNSTSQPGVLFPNQDQHWQIKYKVDATAGYVQVKIDNVMVLNLTGIVTRNTSGGLNFVSSCLWSGPYQVVDDIVCLDLTGTENNDWPGDLRVGCGNVHADGHLSQGTLIGGDIADTNHYTRVNELAVDGDTTAIKLDAGQTELFTTQNPLPIGNVHIHGITLNVIQRKDEAEDILTKGVISQGGVDILTDAELAPGAGYKTSEWAFDKNPFTGTQFVKEDLIADATQFGVKRTDTPAY